MVEPLYAIVRCYQRRYVTKIKLVYAQDKFVPKLGKHVTSYVPKLETYANITSTGIKTSTELFGAIKADSLTIRLMTPDKLPKYSYVQIGDTLYKATEAQYLNNSVTLVTTEVVGVVNAS